MKPIRLLTTGAFGLAAVALAHAAFTNPFTPPFQGQPDTEFSGWECFAFPVGTPNAPDDSGTTSDDAVITQNTQGAQITSTCNIYSPAGPGTFTLTDSVPKDLQEVFIQLQSSTIGNPIDASTVFLSYADGGGAAQVLTFDSATSLAPGEDMFTWDLSGVPDEILAYSIDFSATAAHMSLDAVLLDTRYDEADLGTSYCVATPSSTGLAAEISATGSTSVANNDLVLRAVNLPAFQNGIFFYGPKQAQVPFGNGFRCVGGGALGLFRLQVEQADASGVITHALDITVPPTTLGQITAGSTWNFQTWYRDPAGGGAFFNLSDGLELSFN